MFAIMENRQVYSNSGEFEYTNTNAKLFVTEEAARIFAKKNKLNNAYIQKVETALQITEFRGDKIEI